MAEGVGVSDEQLDEWERLASMMSVSAVYEIAVTGSGAIQALVGEVRASHAREAEQRAATILANKVWAEAAAERDVLQQRIDKALELHQEVSRPAYGGQITDASGNPVPLTPPYSVSCSCGKPYCTVRAALTGTGDTE